MDTVDVPAAARRTTTRWSLPTTLTVGSGRQSSVAPSPTTRSTRSSDVLAAWTGLSHRRCNRAHRHVAPAATVETEPQPVTAQWTGRAVDHRQRQSSARARRSRAPASAPRSTSAARPCARDSRDRPRSRSWRRSCAQRRTACGRSPAGQLVPAPSRPPRRRHLAATSDVKAIGRSPRRALASRSITPRSALTNGARSVLLITSRSAVVTPGPPLRGTLSPPATSITKICRSTSAAAEDRGEVVAAALHQRQLHRRVGGLELLDGVEVGGDVVADRGVRARAGLDAADALVGQHRHAAQRFGVLGGEDVVGDDDDADGAGELPAQRGDERGLAASDRPADADAQRPGAGCAVRPQACRRAGRRGDRACGRRPGGGAGRGCDQEANSLTSQVAWCSARMSASTLVCAGRSLGAQAAGACGGGCCQLVEPRRQPRGQSIDVERVEARAGALPPW